MKSIIITVTTVIIFVITTLRSVEYVEIRLYQLINYAFREYDTSRILCFLKYA